MCLNVSSSFIFKKKPTSPGVRHNKVLSSKIFLGSTKFKSRRVRLHESGGKNNLGHITSYNRSSRKHRRLFKAVLPFNSFFVGVVLCIVPDSSKKSFLCSIFNLIDYSFYYYPYIEGISVGCLVYSDPFGYYFLSRGSLVSLGCLSSLDKFPIGAPVSNVSKSFGFKPFLCKSHGSSAKVVQQKGKAVILMLPSNRAISLPKSAVALGGSIGFSSFLELKKGKASKSRFIGIRPKVRGVAMNPVDHPHGGGEGRSSGGRLSVSPWGKLSKGGRTRSNTKKPYLLLDE